MRTARPEPGRDPPRNRGVEAQVSRRSKGARLVLEEAEYDKRTGKLVRHASWVIRDGQRKTRTGCPPEDVAGAEKALQDYLADKHQPERRRDLPSAKIPLADVLRIWGEEVVPDHAKPAKTDQRILQLSEWWGEKMLAEVNGKACRDYLKWRITQDIKACKPDNTGNAPKKVTPAAVRRELEDLRAAINYHRSEGYCREVIDVWLPPKGESRSRWLRRLEAADLLWTMWRNREVQTIHRGKRKGAKVETKKRPSRHLARFLLVGLYTGTRAASICAAGFEEKPGMAWVDLKTGLYYRKPIGKRATKKRQPPVRLPVRLLAHIRRWKAKGISKEYVVEFNGKPIGEVNKGFGVVREKAGLGPDVTPHVLRHTCATWLMQRGAFPWDAANFLGMTEAMLQQTYGHHHPDYQAATLGKAKVQPPPLGDIFSVAFHPEADWEAFRERRADRKKLASAA
jgi:integrase